MFFLQIAKLLPDIFVFYHVTLFDIIHARGMCKTADFVNNPLIVMNFGPTRTIITAPSNFQLPSHAHNNFKSLISHSNMQYFNIFLYLTEYQYS